MPQLAAMDKRYKSKGLRLIGVHSQGGTDEEILVPVKKNKAKYSIARSGQSPVPFNGIPHMFVFNPKGELVYDGRTGADAEKVIKRELRGVTASGDDDDDDDDEDSPFGPKEPAATGPLVPERAWTSADGRTMKASLISLKDQTGSFKRSDGRTFELALDKLSPADQAVVAEAVKKAAATSAPQTKD